MPLSFINSIFISTGVHFSIYTSLLSLVFKSCIVVVISSALCSCFLGHHSGVLQLSGHTLSLREVRTINAPEAAEECSLPTWSVCFLVNPTCPGLAEPIVGWALPNQSLIKKFPTDLPTGVWMKTFLNEDPSLPRYVYVCVKLTKTNQDLPQGPGQIRVEQRIAGRVWRKIPGIHEDIKGWGTLWEGN